MIIRWILTFAFLMLALVCYISGFGAGGTLFLILGLVFEILFWSGVYGNTKSKKP